MTTDVFVEWLKRQGHHVLQMDSAYWYDIGPRIFQAIPYHKLISPSETELQQLLRFEKAIGLRYSTPLSAKTGKLSYHVVNSSKDYGLAQLPKKARYDVRKGLKFVSVEPISLTRLSDEGWLLRSDTLSRQGRTGAESRQWWQRLCLSAEDLPCFEAWGATHEGKLVASLLAVTIEGCVSILYQQSLTAYLDSGVNNALTFAFTESTLRRDDVDQVFYGLHSLDAPESVDRFKFRMNYRAVPIRQRVVFHPWITPLINQMSYQAVKQLASRKPENAKLTKVEGMIRFYLQGQKPLAEQSWPQCLADQRNLILNI